MTGMKQYLGGKKPKSVVFTANGSFTVPAGVTEVFITGCGGGGSGGFSASSSVAPYQDGNNGGPTQFGTLYGLSGGLGGRATGTSPGSVPGGGRGGHGGQHGQSGYFAQDSGLEALCGDGGDCGPYRGGRACNSYGAGGLNVRDGDYGAGGAGGNAYSYPAGGGGGAEYVERKMLTVLPGATYGILIGKGGKYPNTLSGNGGDGILIVEWWE